jgi:hypothetical protein
LRLLLEGKKEDGNNASAVTARDAASHQRTARNFMLVDVVDVVVSLDLCCCWGANGHHKLLIEMVVQSNKRWVDLQSTPGIYLSVHFTVQHFATRSWQQQSTN